MKSSPKANTRGEIERAAHRKGAEDAVTFVESRFIAHSKSAEALARELNVTTPAITRYLRKRLGWKYSRSDGWQKVN